MLVSIKNIGEAAAKRAGSTLPFPGMGQQTRFHNEMLKVIPLLPREPL